MPGRAAPTSQHRAPREEVGSLSLPPGHAEPLHDVDSWSSSPDPSHRIRARDHNLASVRPPAVDLGFSQSEGLALADAECLPVAREEDPMPNATLTIDLTEPVLASGVVEASGRVRNFIRRVFRPEVTACKFAAEWSPSAVLTVAASAAGLTFNRELLVDWAQPGDRLVLEIDRDHPVIGDATLLDGAAVLVGHFLARADPQFIAVLSTVGLPRDYSAVVRPGHDRDAWRALLEAAESTAIDLEARGAASLAGLNDFLQAREITLEITVDEHEAVSAADLVEGMSASRRARRVVKEPPVRKGNEGTAFRRKVSYTPQHNAVHLIEMLDSIDDAVQRGTTDERPRSRDAVDLLSRIASGLTIKRG